MQIPPSNYLNYPSKNRKISNTKDSYWVTNRKQWGLCSELIIMARKIHTATGILNKKLFKYASGKRILHRTNWDPNTFALIDDTKKQRQKTLCTKVNTEKRAYELQISEHVISLLNHYGF